MKLPKAIEILSTGPSENTIYDMPDYLDAIKLSIEALKAIQDLRIGGVKAAGLPLSGESPEDYHPNTVNILNRLHESPLGKEPKG